MVFISSEIDQKTGGNSLLLEDLKAWAERPGDLIGLSPQGRPGTQEPSYGDLSGLSLSLSLFLYLLTHQSGTWAVAVSQP